MHTPTALNANIAAIILPADAEADDPIRLRNAAQNLFAVIIFFIFDEIVNVFCDFLHSLNELSLSRVAAGHTRHKLSKVYVIPLSHFHSPPNKFH